jgi:signal transduction histidine kinase
MRLADFIVRDMEPILAEWEAFAETLVRAKGMSSLALRDHAEQILLAVAKDIGTAQTDEAQAQKSKGNAPLLFNAPETAAQTHATLRARHGFDIDALASEYRALRASVLRLWAADCGDATLHVDDVIRFNEAIDQALAESIGFFSAEVEQARNLLLGMLGHDMRSPLQTIQLTASYLTALNAGAEVTDASRRLVSSGARMKSLLDDLVDFNRTTLGLGISVEPSPVNLAALFAEEVELQRGAHPAQRFDLAVEGVSDGLWDGMRLQQLLGNLLRNAAKYGARDTPIGVNLQGGEGEVRFEVVNLGPPIEPGSLDSLFNPLQRGSHRADRDASASLGLGLYIAREIAKAHGGEISATSDPGGTVFSVRLPRRTGAAAAPVPA